MTTVKGNVEYRLNVFPKNTFTKGSKGTYHYDGPPVHESIVGTPTESLQESEGKLIEVSWYPPMSPPLGRLSLKFQTAFI